MKAWIVRGKHEKPFCNSIANIEVEEYESDDLFRCLILGNNQRGIRGETNEIN